MILQQEGIYEGTIQAGLRLAETSEAQGGWAEYFCESDAGDLRIEDPILRAQTAIMLENAKRQLARQCGGRVNAQGLMEVNEATMSAMVGGFSDYIFPIIRAGFPTNAINDLVSLQPTTRRHALIMYWNWIIASNKGKYVQGQRLFDAMTGPADTGYGYTSELIEDEKVDEGTGASAVASGTVKYHDGGGVRPGTVMITAIVAGSPVVASDNGNGGWLGGLTGTINYRTGVFTITFGGNIDVSTDVLAIYRYDSEGSDMLPEVDVQITSASVETERRAMKINYSQESVQDIMAEFGIALEPAIIRAASETMNMEIARQLIEIMWSVADVVATFPLTPPSSNYSQQQHFGDVGYKLNKASNRIESNTQTGYGNWIVVDEGGDNLLKSLPAGMFKKSPRPANVRGLHFIGTLNDQYRCYKELSISNKAGASAHGNMLMGFKGTQFYEAGLVWSPYHLMYQTGTLQTANFMNQKGMASRYATKMVNRNMFVRIDLGA